MDKVKFKDLLERYSLDQTSHEEREALYRELAKGEEDVAWEEWITAMLMEEGPEEAIRREAFERLMTKIKQPTAKRVPMHAHKTRRLGPRFAAAAAIILILALGSYFFITNRNHQPETAKITQPVQNDVAPGKDGAVLTLADGRKIILDDAKNGELTKESGATIIKQNGKVVYNQKENVATVSYNTMSTPKGRQFSLVLSDGTKVWLNAASSITYPTAFVGSERKVEITGEAYFEVAHDASKPFIVSKGETSVQVLGTHFNVNTYDDEEAIKVTLLEGRVKVKSQKGSVTIKPGEQAVAKATSLTIDNSPDLDEVMAWKNGRFIFMNADIQTIMRQLARWYDVDVVYEGSIPERQFRGKIGREVNLSEVLKILELSKIHFHIEGKKIIVKE